VASISSTFVMVITMNNHLLPTSSLKRGACANDAPRSAPADEDHINRTVDPRGPFGQPEGAITLP
jgi:hypothetical protein